MAELNEEFVKIICHGARLKGQLREFKSDQLEIIISNMKSVLDEVKAREAEEDRIAEEKKEVLADVFKRMDELGISLDELAELKGRTRSAPSGEPGEKKVRRKSKPRDTSPKYRIVGPDGQVIYWHGLGRKGKHIVDALDGRDPSEFKITDEELAAWRERNSVGQDENEEEES